jgi:hypothetical protein
MGQKPTCKERLSYIELSLTQIASRSRVALTPAPFGKSASKKLGCPVCFRAIVIRKALP